MFVSGAREKPKCAFQRLRARMMRRKRVMLSAIALGGLPASTPLEVPAREVVLPLIEERPREFEPDAHQSGPADEDAPERGDGLIEQGEPFLRPGGRQAPCGLDSREAVEKEHVRPVGPLSRSPGDGAQYLERLDIAALLHQPARGLDPGVFGEMPSRGQGLLGRQVRKRDEHDENDDRYGFFHGLRRWMSAHSPALPRLFLPRVADLPVLHYRVRSRRSVTHFPDKGEGDPEAAFPCFVSPYPRTAGCITLL